MGRGATQEATHLLIRSEQRRVNPPRGRHRPGVGRAVHFLPRPG